MEEKLGLLKRFTENKEKTDGIIKSLVSIRERNPMLSSEIDGIIAIAEKMLD